MSESDSKKQKEKSQLKSKETYALYSFESLKEAIKDYKDKIAGFSVEDSDIEEFLKEKAEDFDKRGIAKVFSMLENVKKILKSSASSAFRSKVFLPKIYLSPTIAKKNYLVGIPKMMKLSYPLYLSDNLVLTKNFKDRDLELRY